MAIYTFKAEQVLPIDVENAWKFFSSPNNLSLITPPEMDFKMLTKLEGQEIYSGMLIDYSLKPLLKVPMKWQTKIGNVKRWEEFTDTQNKGPYKLWEHTHYFIPVEGGVLIKDEVKYELPLGILGDIAYLIFVKRKIRNIFKYRRQILEKTFNTNGNYIN